MGRRGPQPRADKATRLILGDVRVRLGMDPEMDKLYARIMALPRGTRGRTVCAWLITGSKLEQAVPDQELAEMQQQAADMLDNLVV